MSPSWGVGSFSAKHEHPGPASPTVGSAIRARKCSERNTESGLSASRVLIRLDCVFALEMKWVLCFCEYSHTRSVRENGKFYTHPIAPVLYSVLTSSNDIIPHSWKQKLQWFHTGIGNGKKLTGFSLFLVQGRTWTAESGSCGEQQGQISKAESKILPVPCQAFLAHGIPKRHKNTWQNECLRISKHVSKIPDQKTEVKKPTRNELQLIWRHVSRIIKSGDWFCLLCL